MDTKINYTTIDSLSHDGRGIAHINNKITFIENSLPNEEVGFTYTKRHNKFDNGRAIEILKASPDRIVPCCKHYNICGGCSLQHLNPQKQIWLKSQTTQEQLKHIANLDVKNILPPIIGPTTGYRSKARLSVKYVQKKQKVLVGFHEKNGSYVVDTEECPILHPSVGKKIQLLRNLISSLSLYRYIPQIEIACQDNFTALVIRNLQKFSDSDIKLLDNFSQEYNFQIYSQSGGIDTIKLISSNQTNHSLSYKLPKYNVEIIYRPTDFTQINHAINAQLVDRAIELLEIKTTDKILDLFCGIGNFTLPIATKCTMVTGIEGHNGAVLQAKKNAAHNNIKNTDFYHTDLTKELPNSEWAKKAYDKILLDPPRTGAQEICSQIKKFNAKKIVYVSCNPATFSRDAKIIVDQGYILQSISLADMYPHTSHIEIIASFIIYL